MSQNNPGRKYRRQYARGSQRTTVPQTLFFGRPFVTVGRGRLLNLEELLGTYERPRGL